jgi:aspartokinase
MLTIVSAVESLVAISDFAREGLQTGCLNMTAYADSISEEVEKLTKKPVQKGSIVVALARLAKKYRKSLSKLEDFGLLNLVSRSGLTELTYTKTPSLQVSIVKLFERPDIQTAPFCVATIGLGEISIVADAKLARSIQEALGAEAEPILNRLGLSSLTMQVDIATIDMPRQSYTVIRPLALRDINIVEYITSPTELTIILHDADLKESFVVLHDRFFSPAYAE